MTLENQKKLSLELQGRLASAAPMKQLTPQPAQKLTSQVLQLAC